MTHREKAARKLRAATRSLAEALFHARLAVKREGVEEDIPAGIDDARARLAATALDLDPGAYEGRG